MMKFIKNSFKDHPIMGIGSVLLLIYIIGFAVLALYYDDIEEVPDYFTVSLVVILLLGAITVSVGGFFYITSKAGATSFRSRLSTYLGGFLNEVKSPIFISILTISMIAIVVALILGIG
jgi:hypothetical protein